MKRLLSLLTIIAVVLLSASCVSQRRISTEAAAFRPNQVRLDLTMQDYQYLGEVTVSAEYTRYLGIFVKIRSINDVPYDPRNTTYTTINMSSKFYVSRYLHQALYQVTTQYPGADYIIPPTLLLL